MPNPASTAQRPQIGAWTVAGSSLSTTTGVVKAYSSQQARHTMISSRQFHLRDCSTTQRAAGDSGPKAAPLTWVQASTPVRNPWRLQETAPDIGETLPHHFPPQRYAWHVRRIVGASEVEGQ